MVHVKNRKMENRSAHWFGLTDLKNNGKNVRFCYSHLTRNSFNYCERRFFFGLVYDKNELCKIFACLLNKKFNKVSF